MIKKIGIAALVATLRFSGGCASETTASDAPSAEVLQSSGNKIAYGLLGTPGTIQATDPMDVQQRYAVARHIVAIVEQRQPGGIARMSADVQSGEATRVLKGMTWLGAILDETAGGNELVARVAADPLFAGLKVQSLTEAEQSTLGLAGGGTSTGGLGADKNGRYSDSRSGVKGAAEDLKDLPKPPWTPAGAIDAAQRVGTLGDVDAKRITPDPESRLGAYAATTGYPAGTVGNAVHNAIGTIYTTLGNYGQESIGRVFNSPEAQALYNQPVDSPAGRQMADLEHQYWENVRREDPLSAGGQLGSMASPAARDFLQRRVFTWR
jgi:hypothetical protein